jgi:glycosyltransferase involved in cell wall biosynthesis
MSLLRVLVISRNYPNTAIPHQGLWVKRLVDHSRPWCDLRVIAPVPYCPPLPASAHYSKLRRVPRKILLNGVEVRHPRILTGPGYSLHSVQASLYYQGIRRQVAGMRREFPFDLIHAHFSYPEGVVAARLAREHRVPVVITEHAPWQPWMETYPRVRRQAVWAAGRASFHVAVSRYVRDTIVCFTGNNDRLRVIPIGVDGSVFTPLADCAVPDPNQIVYVGRVHRIKGIDVLLQSMRVLCRRRPGLRLKIVGDELFYRGYRIQADQIHRMARDLGFGDRLEFTGVKAPPEVAEIMGRSAVLVLPSRAESFGAVLVEALACGTPVVATRCGGPEDIVTDRVGILVPPEDPDALAHAIDEILERRSEFVAAHLRKYALEGFAYERVARETAALYREAVDSFAQIASWP